MQQAQRCQAYWQAAAGQSEQPQLKQLLYTPPDIRTHCCVDTCELLLLKMLLVEVLNVELLLLLLAALVRLLPLTVVLGAAATVGLVVTFVGSRSSHSGQYTSAAEPQLQQAGPGDCEQLLLVLVVVRKPGAPTCCFAMNRTGLHRVCLLA
jgi:hypothetical protein